MQGYFRDHKGRTEITDRKFYIIILRHYRQKVFEFNEISKISKDEEILIYTPKQTEDSDFDIAIVYNETQSLYIIKVFLSAKSAIQWVSENPCGEEFHPNFQLYKEIGE